MKFRITLPCGAPRLNVALADKNLLSEATICEANIDLSHLFREVHRKKTEKKLPRSEVKLSKFGRLAPFSFYEQITILNRQSLQSW